MKPLPPGLLVVLVVVAAACSDPVTTVNAFVCSSCTNVDGVITNLGPTASEAACEDWATANRCAGFEFFREGQCGGSIELNATCAVAGCEADPTAGCPSPE